LSPCKADIVGRIKGYKATKQPRHDYLELPDLALLFLGETLPEEVIFRPPGAMHHARWMWKAIYSLKVWMFRSEFHLTAKAERGLLNMCLFIVMLYIDLWFTASDPVKAPASDLQFIKNLVKFSDVHRPIANGVLNKVGSHLWYLSERNVSLTREGIQVVNRRSRWDIFFHN